MTAATIALPLEQSVVLADIEQATRRAAPGSSIPERVGVKARGRWVDSKPNQRAATAGVGRPNSQHPLRIQDINVRYSNANALLAKPDRSAYNTQPRAGHPPGDLR